MGEFTSKKWWFQQTELWIQLSTFWVGQHNLKSTTLGGRQPPRNWMVKTKNDQTLWVRWILDPYPSCSSQCPFRWLLSNLLFHIYLAVDGDGEAKNIHPPERLGQPKNSVATVCFFYIAKRWHGMWIWISSLQAVDWTCKFIMFQPLNSTMFFSEQCGYPAAKTSTKLGWKIQCLIVQFQHHCHHLASEMDVLLKIN